VSSIALLPFSFRLVSLLFELAILLFFCIMLALMVSFKWVLIALLKKEFLSDSSFAVATVSYSLSMISPIFQLIFGFSHLSSRPSSTILSYFIHSSHF